MGISRIILIISIVLSAAYAVDKTLVSLSTGSDVVVAATKKIQNTGIFADDKLLLRRTAYVESRDGFDRNTFANKDGKAYYGGIWQVDTKGFQATQDTSAHPGLATKFAQIKAHFGIDWRGVKWQNLTKPLYSALAARLYYSNINALIPRSIADQAAYWKRYYNTASGAGKEMDFIKLISQLENETCTSTKADLIFVLDGSSSIGDINFKSVLDFTKTLVKLLPISKDKVHVGIIQYSNLARVELGLKNSADVNAITGVVQNIQYKRGGTETHLALEAMLQMSLKDGRRNSGAAQIGYVITDGQSFNRLKTAAAAAQARDSGMHLCAFGVGQYYNEAELKAIASAGSCVSELKNFAALGALSFSILDTSCKAAARLPSLPSVAGQKHNFTGVTNAKTPTYYSSNVPAVGLTVHLETTVSEVRVDLYISYTEENPSSAMYDLKGSSDEISALYIPPKLAKRRRRAADPTPNTTAENANYTVYMGIYGRSNADTNFVVTLTAGDYVPSASTVLSSRWFHVVHSWRSYSISRYSKPKLTEQKQCHITSPIIVNLMPNDIGSHRLLTCVPWFIATS